MLTAEVLALTTRVDKQVAARTPPVRFFVSVLICTTPSRREWGMSEPTISHAVPCHLTRVLATDLTLVG
jgi:hypothetical protein